MITSGKNVLIFEQIVSTMYGDQFGELVCGYRGLKG